MQKKPYQPRKIAIGSVFIGGDQPLCIQSMTTYAAVQVEDNVKQIMQLAEAGCEIVRLAVQNMQDAYACEKIKDLLVQKKCFIPIVADVHFYPPAAIFTAQCLEKVRINPGNYSAKRSMQEIEKDLIPLIQVCKTNRTALRIGVNHGSLSSRILDLYGNTPKAMVESAIEYIGLFRKHNFHDLVISLKSSSPIVMMDAYFLLVAVMIRQGWDYPLHIGVTEAGEGEDAIIKSAIGMGALLLRGIGDTIRISITGDPICEIEPCRRMVAFYNKTKEKGFYPLDQDFRRNIVFDNSWKGHKKISIFLPYSGQQTKNDPLIDGVYQVKKHVLTDNDGKQVEGCKILEDQSSIKQSSAKYFLYEIKEDSTSFCPILQKLKDHDCEQPLFVIKRFAGDWLDFLIEASSELGHLVVQEEVQGICLVTPFPNTNIVNFYSSFLLGTKKRFHKTEFIACPGCGRTQYNHQKILLELKQKASHLAHLKIAVMGCIVNGLGEMEDADVGIIGAGPGKVHLYAKKKCVEKNIDESQAVNKMIDYLKRENLWVN